MDIILDSNIYLSDVRMESIAFKNLFDYLRRTKSAIVMPRLLREEVLSKHWSLIEAQGKKVAQAISALNRLRTDATSKDYFRVPDKRTERRSLMKKLRAPARHVAVRFYPEVDGVDINDVFMRGVNRRRPANDNGEELRDVILWLIVLQYAAKEGKEVAFVTGDKGFWAADEAHDNILEDIEKRRLKVHIFHSIEDLVRHSAPQQRALSEDEAHRVFDIEQKYQEIRNRLEIGLRRERRRFSIFDEITSVVVRGAYFSDGISYDINTETRYLEIAYSIDAFAEMASVNFSVGQNLGDANRLVNPLYTNIYRPSIASNLVLADASVDDRFFSSLGPIPAQLEPFQARPANLRQFDVAAKAHVFVRVVGAAAVEVELDRVEIVGLRERTGEDRAPTEAEAT